MNLDIVIIDTLTPDGILSSFKVAPIHENQRVLIDKYRDIYPDKFNEEVDLGGTRIYNSKECLIFRTDTHLRAFNEVDSTFSFQFEYMGIPIGPSREGHGGIYNFILAPGFRLIDFCIVDPFDYKHKDIRQKNNFNTMLFGIRNARFNLLK